jgi:cystathionine beta-lyase
VEATYLAWVDCRDLGLGDDPGQVFLEKGKVAFSSGHIFGPGGQGHIRVNMGTSPEILTEAMRRAGSAL